MPWNDGNVSRLKELWEQGLPTAQIGKLIGFTKNAVVGRLATIIAKIIRKNTGERSKKISIKFVSTESLTLLVNYRNQNKFYDGRLSIQSIAIFSLNNTLSLPTN